MTLPLQFSEKLIPSDRQLVDAKRSVHCSGYPQMPTSLRLLTSSMCARMLERRLNGGTRQ